MKIEKQTLADALADRGFTALTPVQEAVTNPEISGCDLLVSAQTGSGKTVGFGLAIAPALLSESDHFAAASAPLGLVIAPTRELALQVKRELAWLYAKAGAVVASCVGGMDMRDERRALARGAHIVVATPGRLRDHIMRGNIDLGELRAVVLDEADEMLDLGFREDLEFILGAAPDTRQTLLFSATVPQSIASLARNYQKDAVRIATKSEQGQHADIEYRALNVSDRDTENAIINTLRLYEAPNAIVFCNTRAMVNRLTTRLSNRGFSTVSLSGELSQSERTHALQAMRDGRARVCVATDVAARGIDLPNLDLVVHAELPTNHETLLHRSGRTGRAGRKGVSCLIVPPKARKKAERLLKWAKLRAEWSPAPSADAVRSRDAERMLADPAWHDDIEDSARDAVDQLVGIFTAEKIAAAYLRLYQAQHSAPEELSGVDEAPRPRAAFGPSIWFSVAGGRNQGAEPRRLLPMLCKAGQISKDDIGAIRVQQDLAFVELREASVTAFLSSIGADMTVEGHALTRLAAPPELGSRPRSGEDHKAAAAPAKARLDKKPGTTVPVDWNDDPAPRTRKPKPSEKAGKPKLRQKVKPKPKSKPENDAVKSFANKRRDDRTGEKQPGEKRRDEKRAGDARQKGPPPPPGKPSSKKNKARRKSAARESGKPAHGGGGAPKRRK